MKSLSQKVALNATALAVGRLLLSAVGVISVGVATRYLGVKEFGALIIATAYIAVITGFTDLGLSTIAVRELARRPDEMKRILGTLLTLAFLLATAGLVVGLLVMFLTFGGDSRSELREGIVLLLVMGWLPSAPTGVISWYFTAQQKAYLGTIASIIGSVVSLLILGLVVVLGGGFLGIVVAYGATGVAYGLTMIIMSIGKVRLRPVFDPALAWQLLRWALPLGGAVILGSLYLKLDLLLLSHLGTTRDVALYGVAFKLVDILLVLPGYVMITLLPEFARVADQRERLQEVMGKALTVIQVAAIPLLVLSVVFADEIVRTGGGDAYAGSAPLLRILMVGVAVAYVSVVVYQGIIALNRQKLLFYGSIVVLALNIALNVALIPIWGARGSSIAFVVSEVIALATWLVVYAREAALPGLHRLGSVIVAGGLTACVGFVKLLPLAQGASAPVVLVVGGLLGLGVYTGSLYALKAMPREVHTTIVLPLWTRLRPR